jgi:type II secretory pathway pseudopilin PulG
MNAHRLLPSRCRSAFTFVEILAALAFMGLLLPVVMSAILLANRTAVTAERTAVAAQLAENKISELTVADAWTSSETRGDFGTAQPGYRWEFKQNDWGAQTASGMTELSVDVYFQVQGQERSVRLSTLVSQPQTQQ